MTAARLAFCRGRLKVFEATAHGRQDLQTYQEALKLFYESLWYDPTASYSFNALGIAYLEMTSRVQSTDAEDYLKKSIAAFQDAIHFAPLWTYAWHNLALAYTQQGDYSQALHCYQRAMEIRPHAYIAHNLGLLYQFTHRYREAAQAYDKAIKLDDKRPDTHVALGTLLALRNRNKQAEEEFTKALDRDKDNAAARSNLNLLLAHQAGSRR